MSSVKDEKARMMRLMFGNSMTESPTNSETFSGQNVMKNQKDYGQKKRIKP